MTAQHVFEATGDSVGVYGAALGALNEHIQSAIDGAREFHPDAMPFGHRGSFSGRSTISGIVGPRENADWRKRYRLDPEPEAWRWTVSRDCYRPRQGKPGQRARDYLDALKASPPDPAFALVEHVGLPSDVMVGNRIFWPGAWLDGDRVWIYYGTRLDAVGDDGYRRGVVDLAALHPDVREARLSEFHAAREAAEAAA